MNFQSFNGRMIKTIPIVIVGLLLIFSGCEEKKPSKLQEGLVLYRQNQLEQALPLLEGAAQEQGNDPNAHAWLAETYRRLGEKEKAIDSARRALELEPCHSFAHTVLADALNPTYGGWNQADSDSTWHHLLRAAQCDSNDVNVWSSIWVEAIRREDQQLVDKASRRMYQTGFFTPALLAYNRWMLRHLPKDALLVTNGDMDTYPAAALQEIEGFRPDVVIVNRSLLNTTWYARFLRDFKDLSLPYEDAQLDTLRPYRDESGNLITVSDRMIREWMRQRREGQFGRPIAISITVDDRTFAHDTQDHLCLFGPFYSWFPVPASSSIDTAMIRASLKQIDPKDFSGPLVSEADRSPVRMVGTNRLVNNITAAALAYSQALIESGRSQEALKMLAWAQGFEKKTQIGPSFDPQIDELKERAQGKNK